MTYLADIEQLIAEGTFLNMGFNPTLVFSSNHAVIGPHHKSIKYSTNESMILLKTLLFNENTGVGLKIPV